jgi:hypothetical protein
MEDHINRIKKYIEIAIDRCQINQIVFICNEFVMDEKTLEEVKIFLNKNEDYKIKADLLYFFNDFHDLKTNIVIDNQTELEAIEFQIQESIKKVKLKSLAILKEKIYILELNNCFIKILEQVNNAIDSMNYHNWLAIYNPNKNLNVLYLLVKEEHEAFTKFKINIDSNPEQLAQIGEAFYNRQEKLKALKEAIIEFYAQNLFTPYKTAIPEFEYSCKKIDICELAYSIQLSNTSFNEPDLIAQTILKMFKISKDDYSKAIGEIKKRKKDKNTFTKKLSENIETLKTPKTDS